MNQADATTAADRTFVMERVFDAPRELVFEAFSNPEHLKYWWGPKGWTLPVCEVDFRPGGVWLYCMRGPNGEESWGKATYGDIKPPEKIVYTDNFVDRDGNVLANTPQMQITVTFEALEDKTRVINRAVFGSVEELDTVLKMGMAEGANQTWDRLEAFLEHAQKS